MKKKELKDKVIIISGASGGIGQAVAKLFDELGANLVLSDINEKGIADLSNQLSRKPIFIKCDVTNLEQVKNLYKKTLEKFGRIDFLINTVGIIIPAAFEDTTYEDIEKQVRINLFGTIHLEKEIIPIMKKQGKGHIITISSLAGIVPETYSSIYSATKFALRGLNFTLNIELAKQGIIVSTIFPDSVDTPMLRYEAAHGGSPISFIHEPIPPEKVAKAILKAVLKEKVEVCVPRSEGMLSKFAMCFPKLIQWMWPKYEIKGEAKKQEYAKKAEDK